MHPLLKQRTLHFRYSVQKRRRHSGYTLHHRHADNNGGEVHDSMSGHIDTAVDTAVDTRLGWASRPRRTKPTLRNTVRHLGFWNLTPPHRPPPRSPPASPRSIHCFGSQINELDPMSIGGNTGSTHHRRGFFYPTPANCGCTAVALRRSLISEPTPTHHR